MAILSQETSGTVSMNMLLLFCVALEPYLFFVLQSKSSDLSFLNWASFGYALDVGAMFLILGGLIRPILRGKSPGIERGYLHPVLFRRFRVAMFFYAFIGGALLGLSPSLLWDRHTNRPSSVCLLVLRIRLRFPRNIESQTRRTHRAKRSV